MAITAEQIRRLTVIAKSEGVDRLAAELRALTGAQQTAAAAGDQLASSTTKTAASTLSAQRQFDAMSRAIDPVAKAQFELDKAARLSARATLENAANADQAARNFMFYQSRLDKAIDATKQHSAAVGLNRGQVQQLGYQLNDIGTMLLSGSSPFQVMATQGGQVYQALASGQGGVVGGIRGVGTALAGILTPARLAAGAVAGVATAGVLAWSAWDEKVRALQVSLNGLGRSSGLTIDQLGGLAQSVAATGRLSSSQAMTGAATLAGAGIDPTTMTNVLGSSRQFGRAFGMSTSDATSELARIFADPSAGLQEFSKRFGTINAELEQQIRREQALGRIEDARATLFKTFDSALKGTTDSSTALSRSFDAVADKWSAFWALIAKTASQPTTQERIDQAQKSADFERMARSSSAFGSSGYSRLLGGPERAAEANAKAIEDLRKLGEQEIKAAADRKAASDAARQSQIDRVNNQIQDEGRVSAQSIMAVTAAQRLAAEQERLRVAAVHDGTKAVTLATELEKARTMALAEANRAMADAVRQSRDQAAVVGLKPLDAARRQLDFEMRDLRERTTIGNAFSPAAGAPSALRGAEGLAEDFRRRLEALVAAVPGLSITSGFRTREQQERLYAEKPGWAAPPGRSNHERGLAADLAGPLSEAHRRAAEFGLTFPLKDRAVRPEAWHVEPIDARSIRASGMARSAVGGEDEVRRNRMKVIEDQFLGAPFRDAEEELARLNQRTADSAAVFGKTTGEIATLNKQRELEQIVLRNTTTISDEMREKIALLAAGFGEAASKAEKLEQAQRKQIEMMDAVRDVSNDMIGSPLKAIARGQKPDQALREAGMRLGDRMIDMGTGNITEMLFGKRGKPGGGLFGDLLGGVVGQQNTAMMNVQAGMVTVNGGLPGVGGAGSGGLLSSIGSAIFGGGSSVGTGGLWANGGAFLNGSPIPFATGGVVSSATAFPMNGGRTGVMGEAGPEAIMPLTRGPDGRLGVVNHGGAANQNGRSAPILNIRAGDTHVHGNVTEDSLPRLLEAQKAQMAQLEKRIQRNLGAMQAKASALY